MGLFDIFSGKAKIPSLIADNAIIQYRKWRAGVPVNLPVKFEFPEDIALAIWMTRYAQCRNAGTLSRKSEKRLAHYIDTNFPIETMMDFCLSSLDIEFYMAPPDGGGYWEISYSIMEKLNGAKVPTALKDCEKFADKWVHYLSAPRAGL